MEFHPSKVVAQHLRIGIVALVVPTPPSRLAAPSAAIPLCALLRGASSLVELLVKFLLEVLEPAVDLGLGLLKPLLELLLDHRQIVVDKAMLVVVVQLVGLQPRLAATATGTTGTGRR